MLKIVTALIFVMSLSSCIGVLTGVSAVNVANDRRSLGTIVDDNTLHLKILNVIEHDDRFQDAHLNFSIYKTTVLITGEASNQAIKTDIENTLIKKIPTIARIFNEIQIAPVSSLLSRAQDTLTNLKLQTAFYGQEVFHPTHIKTITEAGTVYLMGEVTQREANKATTITAASSGVKKVVKLFTYLQSRPAAEIERDRLREKAVIKQQQLKKQQAEIEAKRAVLLKQIRSLENNETGTTFN